MGEYGIENQFGSIIQAGFDNKQQAEKWLNDFKKSAIIRKL